MYVKLQDMEDHVVSKYPDNNPKTIIGITKPSISKVPPSSIIYTALAMMDGAEKYGPYNWRHNSVSASIYIDACKRHLDSWWDGEEVAEDSKVPHLGHALGCIAIIVDAYENGCLVDDRPKPGRYSEMIKDAIKIIKKREQTND